ncbi:hypothetical protein K0M31_003969, partial [Melipona bicolor]
YSAIERKRIVKGLEKISTAHPESDDIAKFGKSNYKFTRNIRGIEGSARRDFRSEGCAPSVLIIHRLFEYATSPDTKPRKDARRKPGEQPARRFLSRVASAKRARASTLNSNLSADPLTFPSIKDTYLQPAIRPGVGLSRHAGEIPSAREQEKALGRRDCHP